MPGGIQVFSRALGMTTEELFKAMENGELLAHEVLPLVTVELRKTARQNNALTKSLTTSRSQWTLFTNQFKLLFDGFGSTILDRGVGRLIKAFGKLAEVLKPVAQLFFGLLGTVFSLIGVIGKGLLTAFDPFLNMIRAFEIPLMNLARALNIADQGFMEWFGHLAKFGVFLVPWLRAAAIIGGIMEEIVNIFTGHAQGVLAGTGDTFSERFANGMLGRLIPMWDKWWDNTFIPSVKRKADELALIFKEALKSVFPEWMWGMGDALNGVKAFEGAGQAVGVEGLGNNALTNPIGALKSTLSGLDKLFGIDSASQAAQAAQEAATKTRQRQLQSSGVDFIPAGIEAPTILNVHVDGKKTMEEVVRKGLQSEYNIAGGD